MRTIKFRRFTKSKTLREIGRPLLVEFFGRFQTELAAKEVTLPSVELADDNYFNELARLLMSPSGLPDELNEVLFVVDELATEEGMTRLVQEVERRGLEVENHEEDTPASLSLRVWLNHPALLKRKHEEQYLYRLTTFEYWGSHAAQDMRGTFVAPDTEAMEALTGVLDDWFSRNRKGTGTTMIETYEMDEEWWFVIRHGDSYARLERIHNGKTESIHFRPSKEDVVVYNPHRDEIRIKASGVKLIDLYRAQFGYHLRGDKNHFNQIKVYSLAPLIELGGEALAVNDGGEITKIVLREIEVAWCSGYRTSVTWKSDNLIESDWDTIRSKVAAGAELRRAGLDVYFKGVKKPRKVQIRPPGGLKLGRHCDAYAMNEWLSEHGFRASEQGKPERQSTPTGLNVGANRSGVDDASAGNEQVVVES